MDLNQFFVIAGGLLLVSLILLIAGVSLYRNRKEDETALSEKTALARPVQMERPDPSSPAESSPMMKGRAAGQVPPERKAIPEKQPGKPAVPPKGMVEILRVYRDPFDAQLSMKVLGQETEEVDEMSAARLAQLKRVIREIAESVEHVPEPAPGDAPAPAPEAASGEKAILEMAAAQEPLEPAPEDADEDPESPPVPSESIRPVETFADTLPQQPEIRELLFHRRRPKVEDKEPPEPPKSIAEQINEIVQSMLPGSALNGHEVHLAEVPGGGLLITHNGSRYEGIDEVEDPAAKDLIKKAVGVWNERNKLG